VQLDLTIARALGPVNEGRAPREAGRTWKQEPQRRGDLPEAANLASSGIEAASGKGTTFRIVLPLTKTRQF
jgi:hypothetical protein